VAAAAPPLAAATWNCPGERLHYSGVFDDPNLPGEMQTTMGGQGMGFQGVIKSWNDERRFGFIEPAQGGQEIFLHMKAFTERGGRPQVGQHVAFDIELNKDGKKRAKSVQMARPARAATPRRRHRPPEWGAASYLAIPAFALVYLAAAVLWRVPGWLALAYLAASAACFAAYAADKSAAQSGGRRIAESTLLMLGLVGGWPGAIAAQQMLRHKSSKASFRSAFWGTVVLNVAAFLVLSSRVRAAVL
jgi:uncharacterized membrane protein YsdA (DUF1294 family)/cold shock CspA family protein